MELKRELPYLGNTLIIGTGKTAELIYQYLKPHYLNISFIEQDVYYSNSTFLNRPVFKLSEIETIFDKTYSKVFIAIGVNKLNTIRQVIYENLKNKGWGFLTYIHPKATVASSAQIGEHCFIMEGNNIQDFVNIGYNNILWSGNHIGHHSVIGNHNFISSHVVISGNCSIKDNNFFGVNCAIGDSATIGSYNWFSPLTSTVRDVGDETLFKMPKPIISDISTKRYFNV